MACAICVLVIAICCLWSLVYCEELLRLGEEAADGASMAGACATFMSTLLQTQDILSAKAISISAVRVTASDS